MKKTLVLLAVFALVIGLVGNAEAWIVTDIIDPSPDIYIRNGFSLFEWGSANDPYSIIHDITDNGYNPATDTVISGSVDLVLYDDESRRDKVPDNVRIYFSDNGSSGWEYQLQYDVTDLPIVLPLVVDPADLQNGKLGVGFDAVNQGFVNIFFTSDFYLDKSTLTAEAVPEPASIMLLGSGLLGLVGLRRKRS